MKMDKKAVEHLKKLAKIDLTELETEQIQRELSDILSFVEKLNELDSDDVPATNQVTGLEDVVRADEATYNFEKSDMVQTMPDADEQGHLKVHAVFTEDSPSN